MLYRANETSAASTKRPVGFAAACIAALALGLGTTGAANATQPGTEPPAVVKPGAEAPKAAPAPDGTAPEATAPEAAPPDGTPSESAEGQTAEDGAKATDASMVGLPVVTSDGERVGDVERVVAGDDGTMKEVLIRTGGFLGFGAKRIAIPVDKIAQQGKTIRLTMTAKEVGSLPEAPAQSG